MPVAKRGRSRSHPHGRRQADAVATPMAPAHVLAGERGSAVPCLPWSSAVGRHVVTGGVEQKGPGSDRPNVGPEPW